MMKYKKINKILYLIFIFSFCRCTEVKEKISYVPDGNSAKMKSFNIKNDTFCLKLDSISISSQESEVTAQVIFTLKGLPVTFYSNIYKTQVYHSNEIRIPIPQFELITEVNPENIINSKITDSIIQFLRNPFPITSDYYSDNKIEYLDVFLSSYNPSFRKKGDEYVPTYFSRFRVYKDTVVILHDYELFTIDGSSSVIPDSKKQ
jgi:hypothetical protein